MMVSVLYLAMGVVMVLCAKNPDKHKSFLDFLVIGNCRHAAVMTVYADDIFIYTGRFHGDRLDGAAAAFGLSMGNPEFSPLRSDGSNLPGRRFQIMKTTKPAYYALIGMLAGGLTSFGLFCHLDQTRGWNPYGWWFPATFIAAVAGGLAGVFFWGTMNKKNQKRNPS